MANRSQIQGVLILLTNSIIALLFLFDPQRMIYAQTLGGLASAAPPLIPASKLIQQDRAYKIPGTYIVTFKDDVALAIDVTAKVASQLQVLPNLLPNSDDNIRRIAYAFAENYHHDFDPANSILSIWTHGGLRAFLIKGVLEADMLKLAQDPRVEFVEPDVYAKATSVHDQTIGRPSCSGGACAPWHLDRIDQRSTTLDGHYHYQDFSQNYVEIDIVDTGLETTHSEFSQSAGLGNYDCTSTTCSSISSSDCNGHGTGVASVAAGITFGVAKSNVNVVGFRTSSDCTLTLSGSAIMNALTFVTEKKAAAPTFGYVLNLSFEFPTLVSAVERAITSALNAGIPVIVAAGNDASTSNPCNFTPAHVAGTIRVASVDSFGNMASDSNSGPCVDLFAPGVSVTLANNGGALDVQQGCAVTYPNAEASCTLSGTSFAAPVVSGIVSLYLQSNPGASPATVKSVVLLNATSQTIGGAGAGSPSLLAYVGVPGNDSTSIVGTGGGGLGAAGTIYVIVDSLLLL